MVMCVENFIEIPVECSVCLNHKVKLPSDKMFNKIINYQEVIQL